MFMHRSLHPSILWAQHKDTLLLTVSLNDIQDEKFSLEETTFQFSGVGGSDGKHYNVELEFYKDIVPQVRLLLTVITQLGYYCLLVCGKKSQYHKEGYHFEA